MTGLDQSLVDTFEAAADDHGAKAAGEFGDALLCQRHAAWRHQQTRTRVARHRVECAREHVGFHHHACAAAGRRVVDGAVPVGGGIADIVDVEIPDAGGERFAAEAHRERAWKHLRENREHARAPHRQLPCASSSAGGTAVVPGGTTTMCPAMRSTFGTAASVKESISGSPPSTAISMMSPAPKLWTAITVPNLSPDSVTAASPIRSAW